MAQTEQLQVARHSAAEARVMKEELVAVHLDARSELLGQPFHSAERFAERLAEHVADPGFELVTGRIEVISTR
jgi:hypothetical protein